MPQKQSDRSRDTLDDPNDPRELPLPMRAGPKDPFDAQAKGGMIQSVDQDPDPAIRAARSDVESTGEEMPQPTNPRAPQQPLHEQLDQALPLRQPSQVEMLSAEAVDGTRLADAPQSGRIRAGAWVPTSYMQEIGELVQHAQQSPGQAAECAKRIEELARQAQQ